MHETVKQIEIYWTGCNARTPADATNETEKRRVETTRGPQTYEKGHFEFD